MSYIGPESPLVGEVQSSVAASILACAGIMDPEAYPEVAASLPRYIHDEVELAAIEARLDGYDTPRSGDADDYFYTIFHPSRR